MRQAVARAQRAEAVRAAARSWAAAGSVGGEAASAIEQRYPDDRVRVGRAARVLFFLFTGLAALALFGWLWLLSEGILSPGSEAARRSFSAILSFGFGIGLVALAELLSGPLRRARAGAEEAAALLGVGFLISSAGTALAGEHFVSPAPVLGVAALLCAAAAWRWGGALFGAAAAACALLSVTGFAGARWIWIAASLGLLVPLLRTAESIRLAPSQRRAVAAALCVALTAGYAALHPAGVIGPVMAAMEPARWSGDLSQELAPRYFPELLARLGIVILPLALLGAGLRSRRRLLLDMGLILALLSAVWFSHEIGLGPPWLLLLAGGAAAMVLALAMRRYLDGGQGHERHGLTAEPVAGELTAPGTLEVAATLIALAPAARPLPPSPAPELRGEGGEFGGGGSSSSF